MRTKPTNVEIGRRFDAVAPDYRSVSNGYALRRRIELIQTQCRGRCLELGGGPGLLDRIDPTTTWIHTDRSIQMCRSARIQLHGVSVCCDAEVVPFANRTFDTVIISEVIYYLDHPAASLREAARVLKPGGKLLLSTANPHTWVLDRVRGMMRRIGLRRMFLDDGAPRFPGRRRLEPLIADCGFHVDWVRDIVTLPFERFDRINRLLEESPLRQMGLFRLIHATRRVGPVPHQELISHRAGTGDPGGQPAVDL